MSTQERLLTHAEAMVAHGQAETVTDALRALQRALTEPLEES